MTEEIFKYKVKFLETINNTHSKAISSRYIDSYDLEFDKNHKMIAINELIEEGLLTSQSATILLSPKGKIVVKEGYLKVKEKEAEQAKKEKEYQDNIRILAAQQVASFNTQNTYSTNFTTKQLSHQEFEELINSDENSYLDFKMKMYDFENDDSELTKLGKFAKDVISMICTIKVKSSYIITGIGINADGTKNLIGIGRKYDDEFFQSKLKDKINPIPIFKYYNLEYDGLIFGIFEFPVRKYSHPLSNTKKIKGLVVGQFYTRLGSMNTEAIGNVGIQISDWLRSLPDSPKTTVQESKIDLVSELLVKVTVGKAKLSELLVLGRTIAKKLNQSDLVAFCNNEITGYKDLADDDKSKYGSLYKHRFVQTVYSYNGYSFGYRQVTPAFIKAELKRFNDFHELPHFYNHSITEIEHYLDVSNESYVMQKVPVELKTEGKEDKEYILTFYLFKQELNTLYLNIKQELIQRLLLINNDES